jgi:hypothetical protein
MSDDLTDLLGDDEPQRRRRGRPTREEAAAKLQEVMSEALPHYSEFRRPVGVTFLANVMGVQPKQIQKRLEKCPVDDWTRRGQTQQPLYDFVTAMSYLITPQGSIEDWLAQQNQASLPPAVSKMYWDAVNGRIRAMRSAGELWHQEDVLVAFGRVSMLIRQGSKMWLDDMPGRHMLTDEQYSFLIDSVGQMCGQIKEMLEDYPKQFQTTAHSRDIESEISTAKKQGPSESHE